MKYHTRKQSDKKVTIKFLNYDEESFGFDLAWAIWFFFSAVMNLILSVYASIICVCLVTINLPNGGDQNSPLVDILFGVKIKLNF